MSSGATVNPECIETFNDLKLRKKYRYIIYKFKDDMTEVVMEKAVAPESSASGEKEYEKFVEALPSNECRYVIYDLEYDLEGGEGKRNKFFLISWSPDTAPIRQKMLFASTKNALKTSLSGLAIEVQATDVTEVEYEEVVKEVKSKAS
eukprot:TRINITY_DN37753_c0_g1_i1.p1 TRINITY_DN37753_c0_g1~~TRINITY_DN37753_c0_g1_i1.p1  ORF type:complete len:148 (+),score=32.16 TRINITY_DN37753_c0_g1_i1:176-619(+)